MDAPNAGKPVTGLALHYRQNEHQLKGFFSSYYNRLSLSQVRSTERESLKHLTDFSVHIAAMLRQALGQSVVSHRI